MQRLCSSIMTRDKMRGSPRVVQTWYIHKYSEIQNTVKHQSSDTRKIHYVHKHNINASNTHKQHQISQTNKSLEPLSNPVQFMAHESSTRFFVWHDKSVRYASLIFLRQKLVDLWSCGPVEPPQSATRGNHAEAHYRPTKLMTAHDTMDGER